MTMMSDSASKLLVTLYSSNFYDTGIRAECEHLSWRFLGAMHSLFSTRCGRAAAATPPHLCAAMRRVVRRRRKLTYAAATDLANLVMMNKWKPGYPNLVRLRFGPDAKGNP